MARWSPEPEVSQGPLPCPWLGLHCSQLSQMEGGRTLDPLWYQRFPLENLYSGTKPNQLRRRDPPSTTILSPAGKGGDRVCDLSVHESQPRRYPTSSSVEWLQNRIVPEETGSIQRWGGRAPARSESTGRGSRSSWLSSAPPLHPPAVPLALYQFCVVLIEKQSAEGTHSFLVVLFLTHRLEKALTSRDPSLVVARWCQYLGSACLTFACLWLIYCNLPQDRCEPLWSSDSYRYNLLLLEFRVLWSHRSEEVWGLWCGTR